MKFRLASRLRLVCLPVLLAVTLPAPVHAADSRARPYEASDVDRKPEPKRPIRPSYSSSLRRRLTSGEVELSFVVTKEGKVTNIVVVKFSDPDLIDPVYQAYQYAGFTPGTKDGSPVDTHMSAVVPFPNPPRS